MRTLRATTLVLVGATAADAADYALELQSTGLREYYCTITVTLENRTDAPLTEISGFFYSFRGDEQVGRSKGGWFMNVPAGGIAEATFETPNAPCEEVTRYDFVVGACRIGPDFEDKALCAERVLGVAPIYAEAAGT